MAWLPYLSPDAYVTLLAAGDVMVDPYPFGGGVTTLEALAVCTPVVTAPALQSVPALTAGMLRAVAHTVGDGLQHGGLAGLLVASDEAAFVAHTVALLTAAADGPAAAQVEGSGRTLLGETRRALCRPGVGGGGAPVDVLYNATAAVREWEGLLYRLAVVA